MTPFIGQIMRWGMSWQPAGWKFCNGQTLSSAAYPVLYKLIGTTYGGDSTNFAVPNLVLRVPLGTGQRVGYSNYTLGATGGADSVQLNPLQVMQHGHPFYGLNTNATTGNPDATTMFALEDAPSPPPSGLPSVYAGQFSGDIAINFNTVGLSGTASNAPHENRQPFQAVNYCIAVAGLYPS